LSIVSPRDGWTTQDTARLRQYLDSLTLIGL